MLSSTNFTWSTLEYFVSNDLGHKCLLIQKQGVMRNLQLLQILLITEIFSNKENLLLLMFDKFLSFDPILKSESHLPKKLFYLAQWKPFKMMKNAFYFISIALFVLKIFKFLSWLFGHAEETVWLEILG